MTETKHTRGSYSIYKKVNGRFEMIEYCQRDSFNLSAHGFYTVEPTNKENVVIIQGKPLAEWN